MSIIVGLILISGIVALIFLGAFLWAAKSGQFDDVDSPAVRMLIDQKKKERKHLENDD